MDTHYKIFLKSKYCKVADWVLNEEKGAGEANIKYTISKLRERNPDVEFRAVKYTRNTNFITEDMPW